MRIMVFFDLPVVEREDRKRYTKFRKFLLNDGYDMVQFSVYCRLVNGEDAIEKHVKRLNANLPPVGSIRFLQITDKQYGKMKFLVGLPKKKEKIVNTEQMSLF
ncbi:MAG: CRISPR-associated endonuclease Cas2 [Bacillota bacterium]